MLEPRAPDLRKDTIFLEEVYYRDVFELYTKARTARQQLLNLDYEVSENGALHLPLVYALEAWTYHELIGARTGQQDEPYARYLVNPSAWRTALRQYLAFYNEALDRDKDGSLRDDWIRSYDVPLSIVRKTAPELAERIQDYPKPHGYTVCYGVKVGSDGVTRYEGDGSRVSEDWDLFDMYERRYTYQYTQGEDLFGITKAETKVGSKIAVHRYPDDVNSYWSDYECDVVNVSAQTPDRLGGVDLNELIAASLRSDFLESIDKLNEQTAIIVAKEAKAALGKDAVAAYSRLLNSVPQIR